MKLFFLIVGIISLTLGIIGVFLPVLPTTPFLLLTVACFSKSYIKIANKILSNRFIGKYLDDYLKHRKMERSSKMKSIIFLWIGLSVAIYFRSDVTIVLTLIIIGVIITFHIMSLNSKMDE
jgi:uncharacterized membrane protein YbaN (DUF454 family)